MPRSSRHKSHKQSKHSSKDYSDSEEDVVKVKERGSKEENTVRVHRDSASGEKRKISAQVREGGGSKDLGGHGNGEVLEEYVSSKRRKEKSDVVVGGGGDRWSGSGDERGHSDRNVEKEMHKGESLKFDSKLKENSNKGKTRIESKNKSKRYGSGSAGERKEESLTSVVMDKEESKSKGESKSKSDSHSSARREGKDSKDKDKDRRSDKEKNGVQESRSGDAEVKLVDMDAKKKQRSQSGDFSEERKSKHARENFGKANAAELDNSENEVEALRQINCLGFFIFSAEQTIQEDLQNPELEKEIEKRARKRREGFSERDKHYIDSKEGDAKRLSARGDRAKDMKYIDDKQKDGSCADKYQEDGHKDDRRRDEKHRKEADKDSKLQGDKYRDYGEKEARYTDDRHCEDGDKDNRRKDDKHRQDGERDSRRKDDKYQETIERDGRRDDKYDEDGDRDGRHKDIRYHEDGDKDLRRGDEKYYEDGDRDDRCRDNSYRDDGNRDNRHKEEKCREDIERDIRHKDGKQGDDFDREKRPRDTKYRDGHTSRDRSGDKSDHKRFRDDGYAGDHQSRKSSAYDGSPTRDDRTARYRDDQGRRRTNEKEDYGDIRSRGTRDQKTDTEKKSASSARIDLVERVRSTSRNADIELSYSHSRRRSSPTSSSLAPRDHYRVMKQDESKYKDYNYEDRVRHNINSSRDYTGVAGVSEKTTSSWSSEKIGIKDDGHLGELSAERRLKSDIRSSPLRLVDKSPTSSTDRRQLSRTDVRRGIDVEESTQKSGGSRNLKEYSGKEGRGSRELGMDVLPGDEHLQADADTLSVSSPFMRNSHFSSSSKPFRGPPPFRTGVDSPPNMRHRRISDPSMGRIQGNAWRGVPSWPSPVGNGFLPFPHAPPPVGFHSVMQPFPASPMFGVRPSMELNHPSPYHMPDADRFSGPGRPMGWRNQVDDSCPPLQAWDASNAVFGDYGRSDWDHSRNLHSGRGWETSGNLWRGPNRTSSLEMPSSDKENKSARSAEEAFADQSIQSAQNNEQAPADQQAELSNVSQLTKNSEKIDFEAPVISFRETSHIAEMSKKDDERLCHFYLSKFDISADLTEPELLHDKCAGLIDVDPTDGVDAKILFMEEAVEAKMVSHKLPSYTLFAYADDSVFQKSMSLYKRPKENSWAEDGEKLKVISEFIPIAEQNVVDDKTNKLDMQGVEDAPPNFDIEKDPLQIDYPVANVMEKSKEPVPASNHVNMGVNLVFGPHENLVEEKKASVESIERRDTCLPSEVKNVGMELTSNNEELELVDTKCGNLVNADDVSSEAMFPESIVVSESVNLSRIHHSSESTR
ncbi:hypothetical protein BUALT_Bualt10G0113500 [Buddleja alternifolia]|uniref:Uncharacterized protein n=1 Tax=Buddleja alternifolia TaxID=168488 RepID=A0AAV6X548_9LAMI|nr:hypothetical protein BUALT_Bualt10G0113500 [Buddleja alternifolia]